jgi:hypothetical protein
MKRIYILSILMLSALLFSYPRDSYNYLRPNSFNKLEKKNNSYVNWSMGYAVAWGNSVVDMDSDNILLSRNEAEQKAYKNAMKELTEILISLRVNSFKTVYDYIAEKENFGFLFNKYIHNYSKNLLPVTKGYVNVKSGKVFMLFGKNSLLEVFFKAFKDQPVKKVPLFNNNDYIESHTYTGLVIDARGLGFKPNFFPTVFVKDKKGIDRIIYSFHHLDRRRSLKNGSVRYTKTAYNIYMDSVVGSRPYVCHAKRVSGEFNTDLYISREDAIKLLSKSQSAKKLEEGRVLIIVD